MAKLSLRDATKELVESASGILEQATRTRKEADFLYNELRRMEAELNRQKEEEAARRKQREQIRAQSAHTKAFTMLDDDEKEQLAAAMQEDQSAAKKKTDAEKPPAAEP